MAMQLLNASTGGAGAAKAWTRSRASDASVYADGTFGGETVDLEGTVDGTTSWFTINTSTAVGHAQVTFGADEVRGSVTESSTNASSIDLFVE